MLVLNLVAKRFDNSIDGIALGEKFGSVKLRISLSDDPSKLVNTTVPERITERKIKRISYKGNDLRVNGKHILSSREHNEKS